MRSAGSLGSGLLLFGGSKSRGPSAHSSSSHSSRPVRSGPRTTPRPAAQSRARYNQPSGFRGIGGTHPSYYYGRRHDYVYYPMAWTDESTGTSYERGYYDENGTRYDNVSFENNGKYDNVVCHCPYCGHDTVMNLSTDSVSSFDLKCPDCGAPMEIVSELDEYIDSREDRSYSYDSGAERSRKTAKKGKSRLLIILVILAALFFNRSSLIDRFTSSGGNLPWGSTVTDLSEDVVRLAKTGKNSYAVNSNSSDKELVWDADADSYYDEATDCWLWYNTDVDPAVWQYWYEGISSDFGDYGWMEHDSDGWFIEESAGRWIPLPSEYDASRLWFIE